MWAWASIKPGISGPARSIDYPGTGADGGFRLRAHIGDPFALDAHGVIV